MGDENPIRTLGDYSRPSHEGYQNTIELPDGNNVEPLRSNAIRLVQNGCSSNGLQYEDPKQHLKDFLKLVDSLDLDVTNSERMRTIDQLAGGKLRDKNTKESWAPLEYLALYDNESWNDPRDFAKPVKTISLPQDVLMVPMTLNIAWKIPEQAFVDYASSHTDEAGGKWFTFKSEQNNLGDTYNPSWKSHPNLRWRQPQNSQNNFLNAPNRFQPNSSFSNCPLNNPQNFNNQNLEGLVSNFMASQDARLSKFEAFFKQQQIDMTNKIDIFLKAINDRMTRALLSDMVKNPKLNVNSTSLVLSAQPERTLEDEFKDLYLNLPVLEVLAHAPIYNSILDKYVESLELGKNGSIFIQGKMPEKMKVPRLFTLPCRLGDSKPFDTLVGLGSCVNLIPLYLFKKLKNGLLEETDHVFGLADGTNSYPVGIVRNVEVHIGKLKLLEYFYVIDMEKDPATPLLVRRGLLATASAVTKHLMARSGTDLKMAKLVMSSSNHPTFEIEDVFSFNFPDYILASPDYVPALPGKTYSSSSNNSFGLVPIVSPTLSLFHDGPYMKVMHAYYTKESPIPPPTIVPPSTMLSLMFNPQKFFLPEELLSPKKQGHNQSFSSTSALPQEFEMGESPH
ncbi:MAK10-like protein [Tanacetum coccineum]